MRIKLYKTGKGKEAGVAIPEFMISFPVLIILLFGSVDLGTLLQQYLLVQHAATIGAEKVQTLPSLATVIEINNCSSPSKEISKSNYVPLNNIITKMNSVLSSSGKDLKTLYSFCWKGTSGQKRIQIQVSASYEKSKLFQMKGANLTAKVEVPYFFGG